MVERNLEILRLDSSAFSSKDLEKLLDCDPSWLSDKFDVFHSLTKQFDTFPFPAPYPATNLARSDFVFDSSIVYVSLNYIEK